MALLRGTVGRVQLSGAVVVMQSSEQGKSERERERIYALISFLVFPDFGFFYF